LLSFAQFEREVTGERIRDKIAALKKKGMWMGGVVPLGYRVEDRALHIVEDHAEIARSLFRRYIKAGSVVRLKQCLDAEGFRLPIRIDGAGRSTGGVLSRATSTRSCRTRSMSAGSPIRAKSTKANIHRSCPESFGSRSSKAAAIIRAFFSEASRSKTSGRRKPSNSGRLEARAAR
jgi:hypothetical protein